MADSGVGLDYLENRKQVEQGGRIMLWLFPQSQDTVYVLTEPLSTRRRKKKCLRVCLCAAMRAYLCGLVSGDGRVFRYELSAAQFGCGSERNESD